MGENLNKNKKNFFSDIKKDLKKMSIEKKDTPNLEDSLIKIYFTSELLKNPRFEGYSNGVISRLAEIKADLVR